MMNFAQQQEELEYSAAARYDRFEGFDRGDRDEDEAVARAARRARQAAGPVEDDGSNDIPF